MQMKLPRASDILGYGRWMKVCRSQRRGCMKGCAPGSKLERVAGFLLTKLHAEQKDTTVNPKPL